ncbi:MAG: hypothetical protein LBC09_03545 [Helicobacteraceae bacterium]|jgi:hypothetical protein|nr:hypothetical protein [Helicobacteraceae bacterium]
MRVLSQIVGAVIAALGLTAAGFSLLGCDIASGGGGGGYPQPPAEPEVVWLTEEANPFLGEWSSAIPSMGGAILDFKYERNGTVEISYQGQISTNAYIVANGYMVTYLDIEGVGAYTYKVIDNNTIIVTEGEFDEASGAFTPEKTTQLNRKPNTDNFKDADRTTQLSKPFNADNNLTGSWKALLPDGKTVQTYDPFGKLNYFVPYFDVGGGVIYSVNAPCYYSAVGNVFITFMPFGEGGGAEAYEYKKSASDDSLIVTQILGINDDGSRNLGTSATFEPIW